jgi:hypothetical protein
MVWAEVEDTRATLGTRVSLPRVSRLWGIAALYLLFGGLFVFVGGLGLPIVGSLGMRVWTAFSGVGRDLCFATRGVVPRSALAPIPWVTPVWGPRSLGPCGSGTLVDVRVGVGEGDLVDTVWGPIRVVRGHNPFRPSEVGTRRLSVLWATWAQVASLSVVIRPSAQWQPALAAYRTSGLAAVSPSGLLLVRRGVVPSAFEVEGASRMVSTCPPVRVVPSVAGPSPLAPSARVWVCPWSLCSMP